MSVVVKKDDLMMYLCHYESKYAAVNFTVRFLGVTFAEDITI